MAPKGGAWSKACPVNAAVESGWEALCWFIRHSEKSTLNAEDVLQNTDLTDADFDAAWGMPMFSVMRSAIAGRWKAGHP